MDETLPPPPASRAPAAEELVDLEAGLIPSTRVGPLEWQLAHRLAVEVDRQRLALRILAGLPDDAGHTHTAALGDRGSLYARGVLAGADPQDVAGAITRGGEQG